MFLALLCALRAAAELRSAAAVLLPGSQRFRILTWLCHARTETLSRRWRLLLQPLFSPSLAVFEWPASPCSLEDSCLFEWPIAARFCRAGLSKEEPQWLMTRPKTMDKKQ